MRYACKIMIVACALTARAAIGQTPAAPVPVFPAVFPNPTGMNGFEEVVRAGDMVSSIEQLGEAMLPDATMTGKR